MRAITVDPYNWKTVLDIDNNQVFMSSDAGSTWSDVTGNLTSISSLDFRSLAFVPGYLDSSVVIGTRSGVFASRNFGAGWLGTRRHRAS